MPQCCRVFEQFLAAEKTQNAAANEFNPFKALHKVKNSQKNGLKRQMIPVGRCPTISDTDRPESFDGPMKKNVFCRSLLLNIKI